MQTLQQTLQDHDMGFFRILGELWGVDVSSSTPASAVQELCAHMKDPAQLADTIEALPTADIGALARLAAEGGRVASGDFFQRYGRLRSMGPGRRDREKPWRSPISASERLYYHGLLARAFADSPTGPKEFIFIPDDLLPLLREFLESADLTTEATLVRPPDHVNEASSALLDDATTLLAALRRQPLATQSIPQDQFKALTPFLVHPGALQLLLQILLENDYLTQPPIQPKPERLGELLTSPRNEALRALNLAWRDSENWNDFWLLDHLEPASGEWTLGPKSVRSGALARLGAVTRGSWHSLEQFVQQVKADYPTFARPGGDFEGWYLRDRRTGNILRGFDAWDAVDGALLKRIIAGPLHWLGAIDLGNDRAGRPHPTHFRLTPWSQVLFKSDFILDLPEPAAKAELLAQGRLVLPRAVPRQLRYQVARLCSWQAFTEDRYHYQLKPSAVLAAAKQGLTSHHIERLLTDLSDDPIPPSVLEAVQRLLAQGSEAQLLDTTLLRVEKSAVLDALLAKKATSRLIEERLNPTTAVVQRRSIQALLTEAVRQGLLIEPPAEDSGSAE